MTDQGGPGSAALFEKGISRVQAALLCANARIPENAAEFWTSARQDLSLALSASNDPFPAGVELDDLERPLLGGLAFAVAEYYSKNYASCRNWATKISQRCQDDDRPELHELHAECAMWIIASEKALGSDPARTMDMLDEFFALPGISSAHFEWACRQYADESDLLQRADESYLVLKDLVECLDDPLQTPRAMQKIKNHRTRYSPFDDPPGHSQLFARLLDRGLVEFGQDGTLAVAFKGGVAQPSLSSKAVSPWSATLTPPPAAHWVWGKAGNGKPPEFGIIGRPPPKSPQTAGS